MTDVRKKSKLDKSRYGMYFILPFFIVFILIQLYPMLYTLYLSFTSWNGMTPVKQLVGGANYLRLVKDRLFYKTIFNTLFIWIISVTPRMVVGLLVAVALTQYKKVKGASLFRALFYFPNLVTASSISVLLSMILSWQTGILNKLLLSFGLIQSPVEWLGNPFYARSAVAITIWWMWFGHATILFMTGILSVPNDLLESAKVDGANNWKRFCYVTFPLLKPTFSYVFITSLIGGLQNFDIPKILTDGLGSPDKSILTSVMYLYNLTFTSQQFGYGSAIAYGLFVVIMLITLFTFRIINKKNSYE